MTKKTKIILSLFIFATILILPVLSHAQGEGLVPCGKSGQQACTLCHLIIGIKGLIDWGAKILITIALVGVFISGIMYIISGSSPDMAKKAKSFLTASLTGFAIFLMAWFIVNLTIHWIALAKPDLNVGATNWYTFTCDPTSNIYNRTTEGAGGQENLVKCCVKDTQSGQGSYGMASNCIPPNNETSKCDDGYTPMDSPCNTLQACGASQGTPGNCGGFPTSVSNQCPLVSPDLNRMLSCMKSNGVPGTVTSITSRGAGGDLSKSKSCCSSGGGTGVCPHSASSCHHGCKMGSTNQGYSYAIDIGVSGANDSNLCAIADGAKICGAGKIFGPVTKTCPKGATIKAWRGHGTHLHISTGSCNG